MYSYSLPKNANDFSPSPSVSSPSVSSPSFSSPTFNTVTSPSLPTYSSPSPSASPSVISLSSYDSYIPSSYPSSPSPSPSHSHKKHSHSKSHSHSSHSHSSHSHSSNSHNHSSHNHNHSSRGHGHSHSHHKGGGKKAKVNINSQTVYSTKAHFSPIGIACYLIPLLIPIYFIYIFSEYDYLPHSFMLVLACLLAYYFLTYPKVYVIHTDHIKIVNYVVSQTFLLVPLQHIRYVRAGKSIDALLTVGPRYTSSLSNVIEIVKVDGKSVIITPSDRDAFLATLSSALSSFRSRPPSSSSSSSSSSPFSPSMSMYPSPSPSSSSFSPLSPSLSSYPPQSPMPTPSMLGY